MLFRFLKCGQPRLTSRVQAISRYRPLTLEFLEGRIVQSALSGGSIPPTDVGLPAVSGQFVAQPRVQVTTGQWVARHGMTAAQYQSEFNSYTRQGYRLIDVSGYEVGGQARYAALWASMSGPAWAARHGMTASQYQTEFNTLTSQGYRPVLVDGFTVGGQALFAAVFEKSSGVAWAARHGLTSAQYQMEFNTYVAQGYRPVSVSGYSVGAQDYYAAIWDKSSGPAWVARHGLTAAQYQSEFDRLAALGYQPVDVSGYAVNGRDRYAAIWNQSNTPFVARHGLTAAQYQAEFTKYLNQGYRLHTVDGYTVGGQDRYMAVWQNTNYTAAQLRSIDQNVTAFMRQYGVPGASMAIAKNDRLVYASGFGVADQGTGSAVTVNSRFRIASVSKPITSAAIFTLIEQGRLRLTDKVFGSGAVLGTQYGRKAYSTDVKNITVQNLLEHTAGGWGNSADDPMFSNPTLNQGQLIGWVLDNRPLTNTPGTTYSYSNFGYSVLGRVIEKVTGQGYADAVRNLVLTRSGITGMTIGSNALAQRQANEVVYYGQGGENPYNMQVGRMDAHGGWVASATDLLRFAVRVNGQSEKADILSVDSINQMTTGSTANNGYAKGWMVNTASNWWHNGSLPGTASILVRTADGYTWSMLLNTRSRDDAFFSALDNLMWKVVNDVKTFPTIDLWS